jgi:hypothetical protein
VCGVDPHATCRGSGSYGSGWQGSAGQAQLSSARERASMRMRSQRKRASNYQAIIVRCCARQIVCKRKSGRALLRYCYLLQLALEASFLLLPSAILLLTLTLCSFRACRPVPVLLEHPTTHKGVDKGTRTTPEWRALHRGCVIMPWQMRTFIPPDAHHTSPYLSRSNVLTALSQISRTRSRLHPLSTREIRCRFSLINSTPSPRPSGKGTAAEPDGWTCGGKRSSPPTARHGSLSGMRSVRREPLSRLSASPLPTPSQCGPPSVSPFGPPPVSQCGSPLVSPCETPPVSRFGSPPVSPCGTPPVSRFRSIPVSPFESPSALGHVT